MTRQSMTRHTVPAFAANYPERATEVAHLQLTFYCINCQRKRDCTYVTPDFGPFCDLCLAELAPLLKVAPPSVPKPSRHLSRQHAQTCRAYGNYQPPYEPCTCGFDDRFDADRGAER